MAHAAPSIGSLVRSWREQRHLSQLDLATEAEISQKHLSFIESGRAAPSREMVITLADHLDVPLRERNALLLTAGFGPGMRAKSFYASSMALFLSEALTPLLTTIFFIPGT